MFSLEHLSLSVFVNAMVLFAIVFLRSAPPRLVLYICLVGMSAILVPWSTIGAGFSNYVPANVIVNNNAATAAALPLESIDSSIYLQLAGLWLLVGLGWLIVVILRSVETRQRWRSSASCGSELARYANPVFSKLLRRTRIYRIPNSSSVFATGLRRPEIWIGDEIESATQIEAALNHELTHISKNDQLTLFVIVAFERLLWWNPLIWLLGRHARQQMEYACDVHCQSLVGATNYQQALAELLMVQQPVATRLAATLGRKSDIIKRLEKIGMTHIIKPKHILAIALAGSMAAIASASLAESTSNEAPTLIQCHKLLPDGVQYEFRINSAIDTRAGRSGELSVTLIDTANPESREIPAGAGKFLQCIQTVIGTGDEEDWPDAK